MNKTGLLLPVMVILLAGCTAAQSPASTGAATAQQSVEAAADGQSSSVETAADGEQAADAADTAKETAAVKKQLRTIVIPTVYESVTSQEEADEIAKKNGYESAVLEEDGSLTIVMEEDVYETMISSFLDSVQKGVKEIIGDGSVSSVKKIEYNEDLSIFTVTIDADEIGIIERQAADELREADSLLSALAGVPENLLNRAAHVFARGHTVAPDSPVVAEIRLDERAVKDSRAEKVALAPDVAAHEVELAAEGVGVVIVRPVLGYSFLYDWLKIQHKAAFTTLSISPAISPIVRISPPLQQLITCQPHFSAA